MVSRTVNESLPLVHFTNQIGEFSNDEKLGVPTKSQLNLRIALSEYEKSEGLLAFLFTVENPFVLSKLQGFLEDLSRLTAMLLLEKKRMQELMHWYMLAEERKKSADKYQELRHELRILLSTWANKVEMAVNRIQIQEPDSKAAKELILIKRELDESSIHIIKGIERISALGEKNNKTWVKLFSFLEPICKTMLSDGGTSRIADLQLQISVPKTLRVRADEAVLATVVLSLLDNAIIELDLQARGRAKRTKRSIKEGRANIKIEWKQSQSHGELRVSDNGPGVQADVLTKLFQKNVTNRPQGSGFQLMHIKELLNNIGWVISHEAEKPQGACFSIIIPAADIQHNFEVTKASD
jgi:signal transduction histidine kinase